MAWLLVPALVLAAACAPAPATTCPEAAAPEASAPAVSRPGLLATVYTATAAEYRAAARQAFAQATVALDVALADRLVTAAPEQVGDVRDLPPAVILDIDETVLDNSPYQAWLAAVGGRFELATWHAWVEARAARPIPGAVEFTRDAAAKGVTVFYVSNRDASVEAATRDNLVAHGFPLGDGELDTVLLKGERDGWGSAKGSRRAAIATGFRIVMLVGDNLGDFTDQSEGSIDQRGAIVEHHREWWGGRWIILPNPMYGGWEAAALGGAQPADAAATEEALLAPATTWAGPG